MQQFVRGQKARLSDITSSTNLNLKLSLNGSTPNVAFDISCFGLDAADKLSDDRYFIFFNQKSSPCGGILAHGAQGNDQEVFQIDLTKLPSSIRKLVFTINIDGAGTMAQIADGNLRIVVQNTEVAGFKFSGNDFKEEKALIVGEIYMKDVWRFAAVGQGFNGGLSALLKHFGGEEIEASSPPPPAAAPDFQKSAPPVTTAPPPVSLHKVVLDKPNQSHKVSLNKGSNDLIICRAQWSDNGDGIDGNDDLDLRVGILFPNGQMRMIHADDLGSLSNNPYVQHLGDVREPGEEVAKVRPDISSLLGGRIALVFSVYSAIQNGAVSVASLKPKMRMEYGAQVVECVLDFTQPQQSQQPVKKSFFNKVIGAIGGDSLIYTYVIGLAVIDKDSVEITPSGAVAAPMSEATPRLTWKPDGGVTLTMDGNPVFKAN